MDHPGDENVTRLLRQASDGEPRAAEELLPLVYAQLKELARKCMVDERSGHTLQPTALVHEAYLRLVGNADVAWSGRAQFFAAAANAMRRVLVDYARAHGSIKRGGGRKRLLSGAIDLISENSSEFLVLDDAISRLESISPGVGQIVRMRFFAGLSIQETAEALGISASTVKREWTYARAWLSRELSCDDK